MIRADKDEAFAALVYEMRQAQQEYFRCRDSRSLRIARELESRVDKVLKARKARTEQGALLPDM